MLFGIFLFLFVVVCILLCLLVLIQSDKGGGISGAIGGGLAGASSMFGTQDTANVLTKATTGFAAAFGALCIIMSLFIAHPSEKQQKSMLQERASKQQDFSPASVLQGQQTLPLAPKEGAAPVQQGGMGGMPQSLPLQQQGPSGGLPTTKEGGVAPAPVQQDGKAPPQGLPLKQGSSSGLPMPMLPKQAPVEKAATAEKAK